VEVSTSCAICGTFGNYKVVYPSTVDESTFTVEVFSARRLPDQRYYQWVKCNSCGLLRSDPVLDVDLAELYEKSTFDYSAELHGLKNSYRRIVESVCKNAKGKSLVEIGGGNGFFLEEALELGFTGVTEIEPSQHAYLSASEKIRQHFIRSKLTSGIMKENSQDMVVAFHVLDHLPSPSDSLSIIWNFLKPGGGICLAVHNADSLSAKLLKSKSPIFDVEHTFLFTKKTLKALLEMCGFVNVQVNHYKNSYSIAYLIHLLPISRRIKIKLQKYNVLNILKKSRITVPLGNMWAYAEKPTF